MKKVFFWVEVVAMVYFRAGKDPVGKGQIRASVRVVGRDCAVVADELIE
jgi:hypothetical protein